MGEGGGEGGTMPRIPTYTLEGGGSILLINGALGRAVAQGSPTHSDIHPLYEYIYTLRKFCQMYNRNYNHYTLRYTF